MNRKYMYVIVALSLIMLSMLSVALLSAQDVKVAELHFINHIIGGLPEQDVLIENDMGEGMRIPVDAPISSIGLPLYASATGDEHDMFMLGENPLGPYELGEPLGMSLGDWLAGSGSGSYTVDGDVATVEADLNNLIPGGVYTVWCSRVFTPPDFNIVSLPCGADDGSESSFTADDDGNISFSIETFVLDLTTDEGLSLIALSYHSDGQTWGPDAGTFGMNSHVQIFAPIVFTE